MIRRLLLGLVPAAFALAGVAHAQSAPAGPRREPPTAEVKARHDVMQKQHVDDLKTVLRLRPDQEPALAAFIGAHRPQVREFRGLPPESKALTTPQRLETMAKREAEMDAHRDWRRQALKTFYAALSPDQQKVFDALQRLDGPRGGPGFGRHAGPGGGPRMILRRHGGPDGGAPMGPPMGPPGEPPR